MKGSIIEMAIRNIVKFGDPILNKKSRSVEKFDDRLFTLLDDMKETLYKERAQVLRPFRSEFSAVLS